MNATMTLKLSHRATPVSVTKDETTILDSAKKAFYSRKGLEAIIIGEWTFTVRRDKNWAIDLTVWG